MRYLPLLALVAALGCAGRSKETTPGAPKAAPHPVVVAPSPPPYRPAPEPTLYDMPRASEDAAVAASPPTISFPLVMAPDHPVRATGVAPPASQAGLRREPRRVCPLQSSTPRPEAKPPGAERTDDNMRYEVVSSIAAAVCQERERVNPC